MFLDPMLGLDCVSRYNVRAGLCIWILCWGWNGDPMLWLDSVSGSHVGHVNGSKVGCTMFLDPMFGMYLDPKLVGLCFWISCQCWTVYLDPFYGWTIYLDPIFCKGWRSSHLVWDLNAIETCCREISKIRLFSSKVGKQEYNIEYLFYSFLHVANTKKSPFFVKNS